MKRSLYDIFCNSKVSQFKVSANRISKIFSGKMPILMSNKKIRDDFHEAVPDSIGGEMEGGTVMNMLREGDKHSSKGVVIIKGVVDYAAGEKGKSWQYTAAKAALAYTQAKLKAANFQGKIALEYVCTSKTLKVLFN